MGKGKPGILGGFFDVPSHVGSGSKEPVETSGRRLDIATLEARSLYFGRDDNAHDSIDDNGI